MTGRWRPRSLRVRLTLWYAGALAIVLGLYAAGVFVFLRHSLSSALDGQLRDDFELAEQMLDRDREGIRWRVDPEHEEGDAAESGRWVEVWRPDGRRLYPRSGSELDTLGPARSVPSKSDAHPWSADVPGVGRVRVFSACYDIGGLPLVLRVARTEEPLRRELGELLMVLGLGVPLALGLTAVGGYWLARRALAPVGHMADRARTITADRLEDRLPGDDAEGELGQLATVFNETLARLERSFTELRRFTADASHELRTPLTAIRSVGEVGLRTRRDEAAYREIIGSMLELTDRLDQLVDSLLLLCRADGGPPTLRLAPVDLGRLAQEAAAKLEVLAEEKHQILTTEAL